MKIYELSMICGKNKRKFCEFSGCGWLDFSKFFVFVFETPFLKFESFFRKFSSSNRRSDMNMPCVDSIAILQKKIIVLSVMS